MNQTPDDFLFGLKVNTVPNAAKNGDTSAFPQRLRINLGGASRANLLWRLGDGPGAAALSGSQGVSPDAGLDQLLPLIEPGPPDADSQIGWYGSGEGNPPGEPISASSLLSHVPKDLGPRRPVEPASPQLCTGPKARGIEN